MKRITLFLTTLLSAACWAAEPIELVNEHDGKWGWFAFGQGIMDSGVNTTEGFYWIAVNWPKSAWGNGTFFRRESPMDLSQHKKVTLHVSAKQPTQAEVQVQLLTADGAVLGSDPKTPIVLKEGKESLIEVDIASMIPIQAEKDQREFQPADLKAVDKVQIIFMKPAVEEAETVLKLRGMKVVP